jgi:glycosyltransferase involved in cell wall biosynthesis
VDAGDLDGGHRSAPVVGVMSADRIVMVAPLLGDRPGLIPDVFERLGPLLAENHEVHLTSRRRGRIARALDMATTVHHRRRATDVAIVHLYSGRALAVEDLVTRICRRDEIPLVGLLAGGGFPSFRNRHPSWVDRVLGRFDALVAPSNYLAGWASDLGFPTEVIPNPLDIDEYDYRARDSVGPSLFWMRAYHDIYRPSTALDVLDRVRAKLPGARLTMAGPDKGQRSAVEDEVRQRGLEDAVDLLGFVGPAEKRRLFADHDVFLNTPAVDNRPVCIVEAAASGLAVVSTDAGGITSLVEHDVSALLAPVDDAAALADAVVSLVESPDLVTRLTAAARSIADRGRPAQVLDEWNVVLDTVRRSAEKP